MKKPLIIYHANCFDGTCAAWVLSKTFPDAVFYPAHHGMDWHKELDHIIPTTLSIVMVDFSLKRQDMLDMYEAVGGKMVVLDHHVTAQKECEGLSFCKFDMNESGATLAYEYATGGKPDIPVLVRYIKDRDIWKFEEPSSNEINAYIQSFPMDFAEYDRLYYELQSDAGFLNAINVGSGIVRYKDSMVQQIVKNRMQMNVGGYNVPVVNCPVLMSEVGHELAKLNEGPFGAYFFARKDGMTQWGARSIGDFDVSAVAKYYYGGGHKNAAGWQLPTEKK